MKYKSATSCIKPPCKHVPCPECGCETLLRKTYFGLETVFVLCRDCGFECKDWPVKEAI